MLHCCQGAALFQVCRPLVVEQGKQRASSTILPSGMIASNSKLVALAKRRKMPTMNTFEAPVHGTDPLLSILPPAKTDPITARLLSAACFCWKILIPDL